MSLSWLTCKALIERAPHAKQKKLYSFLPQPQKKILSDLRLSTSNWLNEKIRADDGLDLVHPSWIIPFLKNANPQELGWMLAALQPSQAVALKKTLKFLRPLPPLTRLGKTFLRNTIYKKLMKDADVLPLAVIPHSHMDSILRLSHHNLIQLVYLLGLRDLSQYIRMVIDKPKLKQIEIALSSPDFAKIQQLSLKKDPLATGQAGFDVWQGDPKELRILIEQRGINRLAKGLYDENPSYLWYITHIFDINRGTFFTKICQDVGSKETKELLRAQILETMHDESITKSQPKPTS